ncbi:DNA polymerase III subunit gamma/tau [Helicobacter sp. MIT 14-3879]|uniref:DNA polymerase III subunit gamma/tau n=1 Tax=Helicobacter sp. MIT 14-3879 TaxID=2040649 RepID=UPI000E1F314D|nr:DNA polymerase III subunit gamma/tau [Helicobacter sp. MIT 14-3879]RDU64654.1 DNA polymerase III subunit gamma/tau [Helicobacter sp. MIT 14-3879]
MPKALSLKYRPSKFSDLIGQESVSQTLSLALELDKVSHAYLFSGLRGSGKTSSARIFARALQCEKFPTSTPCGECNSCLSAKNNSHMDIIEMDAASSRGIDDIKNLIEQIQYPPAYGRFKVFIIDEIHMLTKEAFNAFLKTLEEPPEYVKFILATTDPLKLPATILSRTQHFRFKKIPQKSIANHLKNILNKENLKFEDEAIELLSRNCSGSLRDAITMLEQSIIFSKENLTLQNISSMLGSLNPTKIEAFFEAILLKDEKLIDELLVEFEMYEVENVLNEMIDFLKNKVLEKNPKYNLVIVERFFKILGEAKVMLGLNADSSFVLLLASLKLKESLNIQEIDKIIAKIEKEILQESSKETNIYNQNQDVNTKENNSIKTENNPINTINIDDSINDIKDSGSIKFNRVVKKIYERDYDLGELFSKNISFVNFENNTLTWESRADEITKDKLKPYFKIIQEIVREIFGDIKIALAKEQFNIINKETSLKENINLDSKVLGSTNADSTSPEVVKNIKNIFNILEMEVIKR